MVTMPAPSPAPTLESKRASLGRLRAGALAWFAGGLVAFLVLAVATLGDRPLDDVLVRIFFAWVATLGLLSIALVRARCPRCGERFFSAPGRRVPWARACLHCGLALGRRPGAGDVSAG